MHFLLVLTDRVHRPSAIVRVTPLYGMCGRVAYLRVAFLQHIAKACEKFVNFEKDFLCEPCVQWNSFIFMYLIHVCACALLHTCCMYVYIIKSMCVSLVPVVVTVTPSLYSVQGLCNMSSRRMWMAYTFVQDFLVIGCLNSMATCLWNSVTSVAHR